MSSVKGESDVTPTESKTTGTVGNFPHGSRETPEAFASSMEADRSHRDRQIERLEQRSAPCSATDAEVRSFHSS